MKPIGKMNFFIVLLLMGVSLLATPTVCLSQTGTIKVSGGVAQLIVSSLSHYNGGVTLTNWSKVKIDYTAGMAGRAWQLRIKASDPDILSDDGNPDLPLSSLKLTPVNIVVTPAAATSYVVNGLFSLTNAGLVFVSGTGVLASFEITFGITYQLGTIVPLLGTSPGYYLTNLEYVLEYF